MESYYLKESCQACDSQAENSQSVRKPPEGAYMLTCPVLVLPWTAAFDHCCRKRTGLGGPLVCMEDPFSWECRQLRDIC